MPKSRKAASALLPSISYQIERGSAPFRAKSHGFVQTLTDHMLTTDVNTERPDVSTAIEGAQAYCMISGPESGHINRISLVSAIGNPIIGK